MSDIGKMYAIASSVAAGKGGSSGGSENGGNTGGDAIMVLLDVNISRDSGQILSGTCSVTHEELYNAFGVKPIFVSAIERFYSEYDDEGNEIGLHPTGYVSYDGVNGIYTTNGNIEFYLSSMGINVLLNPDNEVYSETM